MENTESEVIPAEPARMESHKLRTLIKEARAGQIFLSLQLRDMSLIPMVFLPVGLGAFSNYPKSYVENIGALWEYCHKAGPRSINGMPIFMSCRVLHKNDAQIMIKTMAELEEQENEKLQNFG